MVGISAKQLPYQALHAGGTVEHYSHAFVAGDSRGHRTTIVLAVDGTDPTFPVRVATKEAIPREMMVKRVVYRHGNSIEDTNWRKLHTFCSGAAVACVRGRRRLTESEYESVRSLSTDS
ncbi:unnamed protein product [Phytophthora fragariaefolia]|uniref:Unnamed protein product n=1 Tax=Phytophthora fragariaefolia TaxID=1490495 RepID=A0A9W6XRS8_9STRA|nr:unnamed protein product [Phytophthora fragariaefolia]